MYQQSRFNAMPPVVKNLLIINVLAFIATMILAQQGINLYETFGLYYFDSPQFRPVQVVTHMFMHGGIGHIFFNMFALWMFGTQLENVWGPKRFFIYYFVTGLGAAFLLTATNAVQVYAITGSITNDLNNIPLISQADANTLALVYYVPTVGASGAVFGLLLAFGMLFPNTRLMLIFFPVPIKAKYFVIFYGLAELFLGLGRIQGDNIAHFAHVGGMLFGFILIKIWQNSRRTFY